MITRTGSAVVIQSVMDESEDMSTKIGTRSPYER